MPRAYDIHFQLRATEDVNGEKLFTFAFVSAKGVRGFQKTINQWVKCLLTRKGTDISSPTYGTTFSDLFTTNTSNQSDVAERALIAFDDATDQLKASQRSQTSDMLDDEERLASATLARIERLDPTGYRIYVVLKNILNEGVSYVLPTS